MKYEKAYYWPRWFLQSLKIPARINIATDQINKLCLANAFLWRALNIYDDFLDGQGIARNLPKGNEYYRRFLEIYYRLNLSPGFYKIFNRIVADLDQANRDEASAEKLIIKNRQPKYPKEIAPFINLQNLSKKSLALGLGPIAAMYIGRPDPKQETIRATLNFFRYTLAAKQLSDDSCDWQEDLRAGKITPANALILKATKDPHIGRQIKETTKDFDLIFIKYASKKISAGILDLCLRARQAGLLIGIKDASPIIKNLLVPMEKAASRAEKNRLTCRKML